MGAMDILADASRFIPSVEAPKRYVSLNEKLMWTGLVLVLYFVLTEIPLYGVPKQTYDWLAPLRFIFAGSAGTLMELGIGPIVTAGIILELFVGSGIVTLDLSKPEDREKFTAAQKTFAIIMIIFESAVYVLGGRYGRIGVDLSYLICGIILLQLFVGSFITLLMDELVSTWGIGSGISLIIAAGVAQTIFWEGFSPLKDSYGNIIGAVPALVASGGRNWFRGNYPDMVGLIATLIVFIVVIILQTVRIEIPVSYGGVKGVRGKYPISLLYISNVPVIFAAALFADIYLVAQMAWTRFGASENWLVRSLVSLLGTFEPSPQGGLVPKGGLAYYMNSPTNPSALAADPLRGLTYFLALLVACIVFAIIWVELAGMDPKSIAKQFVSGKMGITGFRSSPRVIESLLRRYIYPVTVVGAVGVAAIAAFGNFAGSLGSGMGVLLATMIIWQYYQNIARERVEETHPILRKILRMR